MRYRVNWRYQSSLAGPWGMGQIVELDPAAAISIDASSPGVLTLVEAKPAPAEPAGVPDDEGALAPATGHRQVKAARNRAKTRSGADR